VPLASAQRIASAPGLAGQRRPTHPRCSGGDRGGEPRALKRPGQPAAGGHGARARVRGEIKKRRPRSSGAPHSPALSRLALEVGNLVGLGVRALLIAGQLLLGLALALLLLAFPAQRSVVGNVAGCLLDPTSDLICNTHGRLLYLACTQRPTRPPDVQTAGWCR